MSSDEITELHMEGNTKESVDKSAEPKENGQGKVTVPYGEMLVNLRKEIRTWKTRLTKSKHRLEKLFKTRAEREEIENCVEEIWELLEEAQTVMDDMSVLALKMDNIQLQSEIMKESDSLQGETQKVMEEAEEKLTDVMLALEKVTESVTGCPSISVSLPPTTQPFSEGQEQQNNTLPPISLQQATQPSSAAQAQQNDASPPISPQQAPQPTNEEQVQQDAPIPAITPQQVPHLYSLGQVSPNASIPTAPNIPTPGSNYPVLPEEQ